MCAVVTGVQTCALPISTPVLVLTARDSWSDKVAGLDAGADDYLAKPFQTEELIARLRALIRRATGNASSELTAGPVRLDTRSGRVTLNGEPEKLTAQEYKRSEEHTSELQSLMRISYAVFCLKKKKTTLQKKYI